MDTQKFKWVIFGFFLFGIFTQSHASSGFVCDIPPYDASTDTTSSTFNWMFYGEQRAPFTDGMHVNTLFDSMKLKRQNIYYVSSRNAKVSIVDNDCFGVSSVLWNGQAMRNGSDPIEGTTTYYQVLNKRQRSDGHYQIDLMLYFSNLGEGYANDVRIGLNAATGSDVPGNYNFILSTVAAVNEKPTFTIHQQEIKNELVGAFYREFGDNNEVRDAQGTRTAYAFDYNALTFNIDDGQAYLKIKFKGDVKNWCDPTITVEGRFHLQPAPTQIDIIWDQALNANFDYPLYCDVAGPALLGPIYYLLNSFAQGDIESTIRGKIQQQIAEVSGFCETIRCSAIINHITMQSSKATVVLNKIYDNIAIRVPYNTTKVYSPRFYGTPINASDEITIIAGGTVDSCRSAGYYVAGNCTSYSVTAAGLFNWKDNSPVPSYWENGIYYPVRYNARMQLAGLTRDVVPYPLPGGLPVYDKNPGALFMRWEDIAGNKSSPFYVGEPCKKRVNPQRSYVAFSANDYKAKTNTQSPMAEYGSGQYRVNIGFIELDTGISNCSGNHMILRDPWWAN